MYTTLLGLIVFQSARNLIYIVSTPYNVYTVVGGVYGWFYPPKTDSEKLIEEIQKFNKNITELRESGVILVDKDGNTRNIII